MLNNIICTREHVNLYKVKFIIHRIYKLTYQTCIHKLWIGDTYCLIKKINEYSHGYVEILIIKIKY